MVPEAIKIAIQSELNIKLTSGELLHGGDINQAAKIDSDSGDRFFLKWNTSAPSDMFKVEANGLVLLDSALTDLIIPEVVLVGDDFLLLEFIEEANSGSSSDFGIQLAKLHKKTNELFGLDHSNYIGRLPQQNKYHNDWLEFFVRERLEPQVKLAIDSGKLPVQLANIFERVMNYTYVVFPEEPPALLHGDLWGGNYMFTADGKTCIYDPSVYYGHREMDLAMTRLFGGFDSDFYQGYNEVYPLQKGFEERSKLCNLYPILVHANLFGGHYVRQAESLLKRFF
ncbi:MAG: fructosamine kinase family protein [Balneolaceae bacterium]|nr:fructosamine kinase family protein [Balneolaceae bacterium]